MTPKFRAFDKATGERFFVTDMDWDEERLVISPEQPPARNGPWHDRKFDEVIFEQSTGLTDANGVEIFEGDEFVSKRYPFYRDAPEMRDGEGKCLEHNYTGTVFVDFEGWFFNLHVVSDRVAGRAVGGSMAEFQLEEGKLDIQVIGQHDYREDA